MNQEVLAIFINDVFDKGSLYQLIDQLREVVKQLYHNRTGSLTQKIDGQLPPNLVKYFTLIEEKYLEPEGEDAQKDFLQQLIEELKKLQVIGVTVAFEPSDHFIAKLNNEISAAAGQKVVLDISVDPKIVGGLVIEYQGKYRDYSLKSKVDEFVKQRISAEIKSKVVAGEPGSKS